MRDKLKEAVPGIDKIPGWALPIVADMQQRAVPGTVLDASVTPDGTLIIKGTVRPDHDHSLNIGGLTVSYHAAAPGSEGLAVVLVVTDPETATPDNPAEITVTATDLATDETATRTAEATDPETAAGKACGAISGAVKEAAGLAPAAPAVVT